MASLPAVVSFSWPWRGGEAVAPVKVRAASPGASASSSATSATSSNKAFSALLSGGVAGCVAKTLTAPLARLTVLAQTSTLLSKCKLASVHGASLEGLGNGSITSGIRGIRCQEGFMALWKGNWMTCLHRFPYTGINFLVVDFCNRNCKDQFQGSASLVPGALAGSIATLACYPLEVVRTRRMALRGETENLNTILRNLFEKEGARGMYRGADVACAVSVPSIAISFSTYPLFNDSMRDYPAPVRNFIAGGLSGVIGSTVTFPLDVLRRRLQVMGMDPSIPQRTWRGEFEYIFRAEGWRGFFRGYGPEVAKVFPTVAVTFCTFEWLRSVLLI